MTQCAECEACSSCSATTVKASIIAAIITAITTALLATIVFAVVLIAVYKFHPKLRSGVSEHTYEELPAEVGGYEELLAEVGGDVGGMTEVNDEEPIYMEIGEISEDVFQIERNEAYGTCR